MHKSNFSFGIIGAGRIAGHNARAIQAASGLELTAISDLDIARAQVYADEFSIPAYSDYREMLDRHPEIDVIVIVTPSGMHFEHAYEMLFDFKKHVVIEKPTFMRISQLQSAYAIAAKNQLQIFPIFQNRYNRAVQRVKQAIANGELGKIRVVNVRVRWCRPQRYYDLAPWRGTYSHDGGALSNQGIHHIDLLRYLGGELKLVNAKMATLGANIEVEDTVVGTVQFANDAVGSLEVTTAARPNDFEASLSIVGSEGLAQLGGIAVNELQIFTPNESECQLHSEDFSDCVYGNGHGYLYQHISDALNQRSSYAISQSDCRHTLSLLHAFYRSDETKQWVRPMDEVDSTRLGRDNEIISQLYRPIREAETV